MKGEKERAKKRKGGEEKKALLVFIIATGYWPKKLLDAKAPFGDNVLKSPARYINEFLKTLPPNRSFPLGGCFLR